MSIFRSREMQKGILFRVLIVIGISLKVNESFGTKGVIYVIIMAFSLFVLELIEEKKREKSIIQMYEDIERILHGEYVSILKDCQEGDMAILSTQINKMINRLSEQTEKIKEEKSFLADSMANISHQIKTPLTTMHLLLSFLGERKLEEKRRLEMVREMNVLVNKIDWLIYSLLKIAKIDAGTISFIKKKINAEELIKSAYDSIAIPLDIREISFEMTVDENTNLTGDLSWLTEALGNVLKNCMEHTPQGGCIEVHAYETPLFTMIRIEDNGKGFLEEDLPHIFERFYRGSNANDESIGIGLALAKSIVTAHDGNITAFNRKTGGACFEMRFYKSVI